MAQKYLHIIRANSENITEMHRSGDVSTGKLSARSEKLILVINYVYECV